MQGAAGLEQRVADEAAVPVQVLLAALKRPSGFGPGLGFLQARHRHDRRLRRHEDRRVEQRADRAGVGDREGAAGQLVRTDLVVPGARGEVGDLASDAAFSSTNLPLSPIAYQTYAIGTSYVQASAWAFRFGLLSPPNNTYSGVQTVAFR